MRVAVLIHAHKGEKLVSRLVTRLCHPLVDIYINVDRKVDIEPFREIIASAQFLENRVEVVWGRFSQVQQIINYYEEIYRKGIDYSHILFISGQDYPVRSIDYIVEKLLSNKDKSYLDYHELESDPWFLLMKKRYEYWYFLPKRDIRNNQYVKRFLTKIGFKRKYPVTPVYYGSCWMCLNMQAVAYVLQYIKENPAFVKFNRYTGCADELFFQSILVNSSFKSSLANNIYRYIDWSGQGKSPKVLTVEDLPKIKDSDVWFVRKVDLDVDQTLIDSLDKLQES